MKKMAFGGLLFAAGALGVIALIAAAIISPLNPWSYNTGWRYYEGWFAVILGMRALAPFIIFCLTGLAGTAICAREAFRGAAKRALKALRDRLRSDY